MDIKIAFFDVDGTLIGKSGHLSKSTIDAISKLADRGILISLATGRSFSAIKELRNSLPLSGPCVVTSGAYIFCPLSNQSIHQGAISESTLSDFVDSVKGADVVTELYSLNDHYIQERSYISDLHDSFYLGQKATVIDYSQIIGQVPILKAEILGETDKVWPILEDVRPKFPDLIFSVAGPSSGHNLLFVNITDSDSSREKAFERALSFANLSPDQAISFGDSDSDAAFLKASALGLAMNNGSQAAKDSADIVIESVDDDGVAVFLEQFFKL